MDMGGRHHWRDDDSAGDHGGGDEDEEEAAGCHGFTRQALFGSRVFLFGSVVFSKWTEMAFK
jgi:hypothetical protein